jgi:AraC-like DNA-binding protein
LANRELSIATLALDVGFSETSEFTAAFHRLTGENPELLSSQSRIIKGVASLHQQNPNVARIGNGTE